MNGAYVCPIFDKENDFEYGYAFVESAIKHKTVNELYFVFSFLSHQEKFNIECNRRFGIQPESILLDDPLKDCMNPVTIKKYFGVKELINKYDYVAAIDCESLFIRDFDSGTLMDRIWRAESFLNCNKAVMAANDLYNCACALRLDKDMSLIEETEDFSVTWWFNEIPVYKSAYMGEFFDWLYSDGRFDIVYQNWCCFDYYVYIIWLILYKGYHLHVLKGSAYNGIIECLWYSLSKHPMRIEQRFNTHWTSRKGNVSDNDNICLQFHTDRVYKGNSITKELRIIKRHLENCYIRIKLLLFHPAK